MAREAGSCSLKLIRVSEFTPCKIQKAYFSWAFRVGRVHSQWVYLRLAHLFSQDIHLDQPQPQVFACSQLLKVVEDLLSGRKGTETKESLDDVGAKSGVMGPT